MKNSALVVIDLQNDITKHYREIIENVNVVMSGPSKRSCGSSTFSTTTCPQERGPSSPAPAARGQPVPELNVVSDHIFKKSKSSALTSEAFTAFIRENGITEFYLAGADAAACIKSTCFNLAKNDIGAHALSDLHHELRQKEAAGAARRLRKQGLLCQNASGDHTGIVRQVNQQMNLRITEDGAVRDVQEIHELLPGNGIITQRNYDLK